MDSSYFNYESFIDCNAVIYANKKLMRYFQAKFNLNTDGIFELESITREVIIRKSNYTPKQYIFEYYAYDEIHPLLVYVTEKSLNQILILEKDYWVFMNENKNKTTFVIIKIINIKASCKEVKEIYINKEV